MNLGPFYRFSRVRFHMFFTSIIPVSFKKHNPVELALKTRQHLFNAADVQVLLKEYDTDPGTPAFKPSNL